MFNSIHLGGGSRSRSRSIASPRARPSQSSRTRYNIRPASQMEYLNSRRGVKKYGDGFVTAPMLSVLPEEYIPPSRDYEPTDPNLEERGEAAAEHCWQGQAGYLARQHRQHAWEDRPCSNSAAVVAAGALSSSSSFTVQRCSSH